MRIRIKPPGRLAEVPISYMEIAHADCMKDVFKAIANSPGGVFYHCTAGKDRTGVISAILLLIAAVPDEDIVYDYAIKKGYSYNAN